MASSAGAHAGSGTDLEPLYCAEQIKVPAALPEVLKAWTKQVIREGIPQVSSERSGGRGGRGGDRGGGSGGGSGSGGTAARFGAALGSVRRTTIGLAPRSDQLVAERAPPPQHRRHTGRVRLRLLLWRGARSNPMLPHPDAPHAGGAQRVERDVLCAPACRAQQQEGGRKRCEPGRRRARGRGQPRGRGGGQGAVSAAGESGKRTFHSCVTSPALSSSLASLARRDVVTPPPPTRIIHASSASIL